MRQAQYSSKVQQPPHTAASSDDRQHTQLAGTTAKRPAAPLVRDEAAAGSNPVRPTRWRRRSAPIWPAITVPVQLQAFAEFYAAAPDDCPRIVLISMGDWQLAEDLAADAFTKAWMAWRKVSQLAEGGTSCNPSERGLFYFSRSSIDL